VQEKNQKMASPENTDEETGREADDNPETDGGALLAASNHDVRDEELTIPQRLCESKSEDLFDDDPELNAELKKFDLMCETLNNFTDFSYGDEWITAYPKDRLQFDT
jgi:hypothetical protein